MQLIDRIGRVIGTRAFVRQLWLDGYILADFQCQWLNDCRNDAGQHEFDKLRPAFQEAIAAGEGELRAAELRTRYVSLEPDALRERIEQLEVERAADLRLIDRLIDKLGMLEPTVEDLERDLGSVQGQLSEQENTVSNLEIAVGKIEDDYNFRDEIDNLRRDLDDIDPRIRC